MQRNSEDFIELLKPVYNDALNYCSALARNQADAKDLLQDVLLKALENFVRLKDEKKFKAWLFTILTRQYYTMYNKSVTQKKLFNNVACETIEFPNVFQKEIDEVKQKALLASLNLITEKERTAILLFEVGRFSMEEIRIIQGEKSLSAVKSRINRARAKLKDLIVGIESKALANG